MQLMIENVCEKGTKQNTKCQFREKMHFVITRQFDIRFGFKKKKILMRKPGFYYVMQQNVANFNFF